MKKLRLILSALILSNFIFAQTTPTLKQVAAAGNVAWRPLFYNSNFHNGATNFQIMDKKYIDSIIPVLAPPTPAWLLNGNTNGSLKYIGTNNTDDFPIRTNGNEVARFTSSSKNLGVGITAPLTKVHIAANDATSNYASDRYETGPSAGPAGIMGRRANGTISSPNGVLANDEISALGARGYHNGGAFSNITSGNAMFYAEENFTPTAQGTGFKIQTTPIGSTTVGNNFNISGAGIVTFAGSNFTPNLGSFDGASRQIKYSPSVVAMDFASFVLYDVPQNISLDFNNRQLLSAAGNVDVQWGVGFTSINGTNGDLDLVGKSTHDFRIGGDPNGTPGNGLYLKAYDGSTWQTGIKYLNVGSGAPNISLVPSVGNVGIATSSILARLHITGSGTTTSTKSLKIDNSSSVELFSVYDAGQISAGDNSNGLFIGLNSGQNISGSLYSTGVGVASLQSMVTGNYNSAFGYNSLNQLNGGDRNTAVGFSASANVTTGFGNATLGWGAASTSTGSFNTAVGYGALQSNTNGANTAVGGNCSSNSTGQDLTIVGFQAGDFGTTGDGNSYFGSSAHRRNVTGRFNSVFGAYAAEFNVAAGSNGTYFGYEAGYFNNDQGDGSGTIGKDNNTFIGMQTGFQSKSANSVFLGYQAGFYETADNKLFIDNQNRGDEATSRTNSLIYGIFDASPTNQYLTVNGNFIVNGTYKDATLVNALDLSSRYGYDTGGLLSFDFDSRRAINAGGFEIFNWQNNVAYSNTGSQVQFDFSNDPYLSLRPSGGGVMIGGSTIAATAVLDVQSTTQGFLPPRMTTTQKLAITSPTEGLVVYDLTLHKLSYYNGSAWTNL